MSIKENLIELINLKMPDNEDFLDLKANLDSVPLAVIESQLELKEFEDLLLFSRLLSSAIRKEFDRTNKKPQSSNSEASNH